MKKLSFILIAIAGLLSLFSCKKDETKVVFNNITTSQLQSPANQTSFVLLKANKDSVLTTFAWNKSESSPGNLGTVSYSLEMDTAGNNFSKSKVLFAGEDLSYAITVLSMNTLLLGDMKDKPDIESAYEFRVKSSLYSSSANEDKISDVITLKLTAYSTAVTDTAKLILSLVPAQSIFSLDADGKYTGMVKLTEGTTFTLTDPATSKIYGGTGGVLSENGAPFSVAKAGWYNMSVNTGALTYEIAPYMIGVVGSATPNSWNAPDSKMDYILKTGNWAITMDLQPSLDGTVLKNEFKFRLNDAWDWNLGGTTTSLTHGGPNIVVAEAGNYTIVLTITNATTGFETGTFTMVKN
jgi:hypothetical protein